MSKDEAIKIFNTLLLFKRVDAPTEEIEECCKMAIKALQKEPCEDAISRQALLNATVNKNSIWNKITDSKGENLEAIISNLPTVTPQEPRKGHWIADVDRWGDVVTSVNGYKCDKCNAFNSFKDNYCPNCGADMREVEE